MKRILRVGVLAFSLVGMLGVQARPALASETIEISFTGLAAIGAGYSSFGFPAGDPSKTTVPSTTTKTEHGVTHVNYSGFHNSASVAFASATCGAGKQTTGKAKHAAGAGTCSIAASGFIHGYCGQSTGTLSGSLHTSMNSVAPPGGHVSQHYSFRIKFTVTGPAVSFTGTIHNHTLGQSGSIVGTAASAIDATTGSCTNKAPKNFSITGSATART